MSPLYLVQDLSRTPSVELIDLKYLRALTVT